MRSRERVGLLTTGSGIKIRRRQRLVVDGACRPVPSGRRPSPRSRSACILVSLRSAGLLAAKGSGRNLQRTARPWRSVAPGSRPSACRFRPVPLRRPATASHAGGRRSGRTVRRRLRPARFHRRRAGVLERERRAGLHHRRWRAARRARLRRMKTRRLTASSRMSVSPYLDCHHRLSNLPLRGAGIGRVTEFLSGQLR